MKPKIIAIYWTFNPDIKVLRLSLRNLINDIDEIIIVDNGSKNIKELKELATEFIPGKVNIVELGRNLGVKALNTGIRKAVEQGADWVLLMDDDSIYPANTLRKVLLAYNILCKYKHDLCSKVGVISLPIWRCKTNSTLVIYYYTWQFSVSLIKIELFKLYNIFIDEKLFLDMADHKFYDTIHKLRYITIHYTRSKLLHKSGREIILPMMLRPWRKRAWRVYTPWRYYMRVRNSIILLRDCFWDPLMHYATSFWLGYL
jgi:rhamnosyltransferase